MEYGLPRHQILALASKYETEILKHEKEIDLNKDGRVKREEWSQWVSANSRSKNLPKNTILEGVFQVLIYQPSTTFEWCPPPLFILGISFIQILLYLLWYVLKNL